MEVRLNSPRGKFKRTNMADDQVDLTPEVDIPGAGFIEEEIEKLNIAQLKLWLKCLCINQMVIRRTVGKVGVHHPASRNRSAVLYAVYFQLQVVDMVV